VTEAGGIHEAVFEVMSKYTLQIRGEALEDALIALDAAEGVNAPSVESWSTEPGFDSEKISVTVDASSLDQAKTRLLDALPEQGDYTVARPEPLEDEDDEPGWL
jgi:hypothetical protein